MLFVGIAGGILLLAVIIWLYYRRKMLQKRLTYNDVVGPENRQKTKGRIFRWICLNLGAWSALVYLC